MTNVPDNGSPPNINQLKSQFDSLKQRAVKIEDYFAATSPSLSVHSPNAQEAFVQAIMDSELITPLLGDIDSVFFELEATGFSPDNLPEDFIHNFEDYCNTFFPDALAQSCISSNVLMRAWLTSFQLQIGLVEALVLRVENILKNVEIGTNSQPELKELFTNPPILESIVRKREAEEQKERDRKVEHARQVQEILNMVKDILQSKPNPEDLNTGTDGTHRITYITVATTKQGYSHEVLQTAEQRLREITTNTPWEPYVISWSDFYSSGSRLALRYFEPLNP